MEFKPSNSSWAKRWNRDTMEFNLNKWMKDSQTIINDRTKQGNHFIVMKFSLTSLLTEKSIEKVLSEINQYVESITEKKIM